MKRIEVNFYDFETGATSPVDVITVPDGYTEKDYVNDCMRYADNEYVEMLKNGKILFRGGKISFNVVG